MSNWLTIYQVDAFTNQLFKGNPAAVVPLTEWLDDELLQKIAAENNLSETAFFALDEQGELLLRWFTPTSEVELCGHATLATAHVLFEEMGFGDDQITFQTKYKGPLTVTKESEGYSMAFPNLKPEAVAEVPQAISSGLQLEISETLVSDDYLVVLPSEEDVRAISPDFKILAQLDRRGVIVTAPGKDVDFVSRYFAPAFGIDEDPVTGSAHCVSAPFWAEKLGKQTLTARQVSEREGELACIVSDQVVTLKGDAVLYMKGSILVA
ncbi:PhzF family phenazine biosynthesis protein [Litoribrevibacter albus]|uniref:Isomerase n=1 Tax=Litoribrevibacter albus TaxID=1473156 RepID=A0AA37SCB1_9GAMM|nr:PhzF family phenazine biosynthesis protein [Litoribrevibacter albus]GLQ32183.1 putative isomerase [Litoribrevibacter albus]